MIEPREFEIREIGKTPHGGTYHIATFLIAIQGNCCQGKRQTQFLFVNMMITISVFIIQNC